MNIKQKFSYDNILAISIGILYVWFGTLKYFPSYSPAENLASNTINVLTFNLIPLRASIILLAIWESVVGIMLIFNIYRKASASIALLHMALTFTPILIVPEQVFVSAPFQLTLLGQYIIKNIVIIVGLLILYQVPSNKPEPILSSN